MNTQNERENKIEQNEIPSHDNFEKEMSEQCQIRRDKLSELIDIGKNPYEVTKYAKDTLSEDIKSDFEGYEGREVTVAGRMMSKRGMGKASFINIKDFAGTIQSYVRIDDVGAESYNSFKKWDIGDIIGVKGKVFKTKSGEISIHADDISLLSKSLIPLPEKWHGLRDTEIRYRQRYLDLIVNDGVKETFIKRSKIIKSMRNFLDGEGFIEVETPVLGHIAGGAAARPFLTHHNALDIAMNLRISLELHLKRLIVGGFDKVYEIGRVFRNEGIDTRHNPEFTLMELYQTYTDYEGIMDLTERMLKHITFEILGEYQIGYLDEVIDMGKPFARMSMVEAVRKYAGVDFDEIKSLDAAREAAKAHNIEFETRHGKGDIVNLFFEEYVESKLVQPTFITGHPVEISPLAKKIPSNPEYTERFELFITGREIGNAFSELNDPIDQKNRFIEQLKNKNAGDLEAYENDDDFITALEYGMPPTGGLGVGIDRLVMLLCGEASLRDVILFPTMRPVNDAKEQK